MKSSLFEKTVFKRRLFFLLFDIGLISAAMFISFWIRFNGDIPPDYQRILPYYIGLALIIKLFYLALINLYDISWRYVGMEEVIGVVKAVILGSLTLGMVMFLIRTFDPFEGTLFPRSVLVIDFIITLFFIGAFRASKRIFLEGVTSAFRYRKGKKRLLIAGAGDAGEQIVREIIRNKNSQYLPVGFVDDDKAKQGINIRGVKVLGTSEQIPQIVNADRIDEVLIALPSASSRQIKRIVNWIRESNQVKNIKILPGLRDLMDGKVTLSDIKEIQLEDLLGREPVNIDLNTIKRSFRKKRILVTGAGGSIGSELSRTVLQFNPDSLVILDIDETEIYLLLNELAPYRRIINPVIGDVRDKTRMDYIIKKYRPQILFHSAAYKHVPMQEDNPEEAVKTNVLGTKILAETAIRYGVERFVNISTDKAVNPTSIMGATKQVGERMLRIFDRGSQTQFISVRFGNVLGSRGSVIPLFKEQIKKGGPVTVTHPDMKRYFMMTSEAVLLVLEASALGEGGEVFILDMGQPVKISDLAREMIRLSGYESDEEIPIVYTEMRPGEKIFEEILNKEEGAEPTRYERLFKAKSPNQMDPDKIKDHINKLIDLSRGSGNASEISEILKIMVPTFHKTSSHPKREPSIPSNSK